MTESWRALKRNSDNVTASFRFLEGRSKSSARDPDQLAANEPADSPKAPTRRFVGSSCRLPPALAFYARMKFLPATDAA